MIAQLLLTVMLFTILLYASMTYRQAPIIGFLSVVAAFGGLYFIWFPTHATRLAELVGIGRGVDLILYTWVVISLIMLLNLHLKLRTQLELITLLARKIAIADAASSLPAPSAGPRSAGSA
jgi:small membrane protein